MTEWYYRDTQSRKIGPLSTDEFEERVTQGEIQAQTRVWRSGLHDWTTYAALLARESQFLATASGPTASTAPQSSSFTTHFALGASATHRPPSEFGNATPASSLQSTPAPAFELCPGCEEEMPSALFRILGSRRICGSCVHHAQFKAGRNRHREVRGADANWLGRYFVRLALLAGAFLAIRILFQEMVGIHPATAITRPAPEDHSARPSDLGIVPEAGL